MMSAVQSEKVGLLLYGGQARLDSLRKLWSKVENDPEFSKSQRLNMNHSERYVDACRKIKRFQEVAEEENFQTLDEMYDAYLAIDENLPIDVHLSMFIPIMNMHTSPEQKVRWLHSAKTFRIIGAYAQTELAHGSNVRGIETTATYDKGTDEFVVHTPSLTRCVSVHIPSPYSQSASVRCIPNLTEATVTRQASVDCCYLRSFFLSLHIAISDLRAKWWPGGLGHTATHAVVYANLILKNKNFGPHPFMVQLRSLQDHTPLPGIHLGDLGPKQGYNSMDNGYAIFDQVRIPRADMLMGFAQVSSDGLYTKQEGAEKIAFGIMLDVRARICINSAYVLARALTISIRYSCVRVQGFIDNTGKSPIERAVMEYPTQQRVLMPLLAMAYALHFTGVSVKASYVAYTSSGDASLLSELHATSAGLKAYITTRVSEGMEACRKMCGGHGFLVNAGFADLYTSYLPFSTLEGTKEVLQQQMGRFLLKQFMITLSCIKKREKKSSKISPSASYMSEFMTQKSSPIDLKSLLKLAERGFDGVNSVDYNAIENVVFKAHRARATWCVSVAAAAVEAATKKEKLESKSPRVLSSHLDPLLVASVELCAAAEAHSELLILESFAQGILLQTKGSSGDGGGAIHLGYAEMKALRAMFVLLGVTMMGSSSGQFLAAGALSVKDLTSIGVIEGLLCREMRTDCLHLVDAWQFSDERLDSTLGRADGKVYEALYEAAQHEPLNVRAVSEGYSKYLKHVINRPEGAGARRDLNGKYTAKL